MQLITVTKEDTVDSRLNSVFEPAEKTEFNCVYRI